MAVISKNVFLSSYEIELFNLISYVLMASTTMQCVVESEFSESVSLPISFLRNNKQILLIILAIKMFYFLYLHTYVHTYALISIFSDNYFLSHIIYYTIRTHIGSYIVFLFVSKTNKSINFPPL